LMRKELEIQKHKLSILGSQINEHFVSNSIARIYSLLEMEKIEEAKVYANTFVSFLRQYMSGLDRTFNSLHSELKMVKSYVEMQNLRDRNILLTLPTNGSIDARKIMMPHFILQPIVENAVTHGFSNLKNSKEEIGIEVKKTVDYLQIIITDNGSGNHQKNPHKNNLHGIGLANINKRLKLMNKKNKIEMQPGVEGMKTIITIYQKSILS